MCSFSQVLSVGYICLANIQKRIQNTFITPENSLTLSQSVLSFHTFLKKIHNHSSDFYHHDYFICS